MCGPRLRAQKMTILTEFKTERKTARQTNDGSQADDEFTVMDVDEE